LASARASGRPDVLEFLNPPVQPLDLAYVALYILAAVAVGWLSSGGAMCSRRAGGYTERMAKVMSRLKPVARGGYARPFTRAELERMYDAGILRPDEKIELISGELIPKELPMKSAHATAIRLV
jgi:hypothetical protein